jgi:hypothetical protein
MGMEYAGAVDVTPPFRASAQDWVRGSGWTPSCDGQTIRPRSGISLADCVASLRDLVTLDSGMRTYDGVVAAYDVESRELVTVTVREGRVSRRTVRKAPARLTSNVVELDTHRRMRSRAIS